MLVCFSEEADPSCSASTLSNEEYSSLLDAGTSVDMFAS